MKYLQKWEGGQTPTLEHNAIILNEETKKITLKKGTPVDPYEYVDLGLPSGLLWATCNVGATKPEDYGLYFQWGATEGYKYNSAEALAHSTWTTAPFNNGSSSYDATYFASVSGNVLTTKEGEYFPILKSQYDAATANMGGDWRMPTYTEIAELTANTTVTWVSDYEGTGVAGQKFNAVNGNYIFIPAAGCYENISLKRIGEYGYIWASSLYAISSVFSWFLFFQSSYTTTDYNYRLAGRNIRAVKPKKS